MFRILSFGSNSSSQLGLSHTNDVSQPTAAHLLDHQSFDVEDDYDHPISIAAGGNHTLILFRSGAVFAAGSNAFCCCTLAADVGKSETFQQVVFDDDGGSGGLVDRFKAVAATWEASFFVTIDNVLYVAGRGLKGELGLGEGVTETVSAPRAVRGFPPKSTTIGKIASCMGHVVVVLSSGEVWGWGTSRKGQLGETLRARAVVPEPMKINEFEGLEVLDVACGRDFTVSKARRDDRAEFMLLGMGKGLVGWKLQTSLQTSPSVFASWGNVYLLDREGKISGFGRSDRGQLPPSDLPPLCEAAAGSEHCLGLTRDGSVVAWGWGEHGNCGIEVGERGRTSDSFGLIPIGLDSGWTVSMVGAGCATSFVVIRKASKLVT